MAEVYFQHLCKQSDLHGISVTSAGLHTRNGDDASQWAKKTIESEGLLLQNFKSAQVSIFALKDMSIIIGMTSNHTREIIHLLPYANSKIFTLMSFLGSNEDISDPYGGNYAKFKKCFDKMKPALHALLDYVSVNLYENR